MHYNKHYKCCFIDRWNNCPFFGLSIDKNAIINKSKKIPYCWFDIQFTIVDEISMANCTMFITMHLKLQKLKSSILPFGGFNILFIGDFLQFPPITYTPLFSTNIQPNFTFTNSMQKKVIGKICGKITFAQITLY
jgi:hypothetical protein